MKGGSKFGPTVLKTLEARMSPADLARARAVDYFFTSRTSTSLSPGTIRTP